MAVSRKTWGSLKPWFVRVREGNEKAQARGMRHGYRSGLEEQNARKLSAAGLPVLYEVTKIKYTIPESLHTYTPDFDIPGAFIIETKGKLEPGDRAKHLYIKAQHPDYDIRFVFSRATDPINKGSRTSYADWANKHGFKWAHKLVPDVWIEEAKQRIATSPPTNTETTDAA